MTYGLIARADSGGLAQITEALARHVPPAKTLVVDLEADGRGPCRPEQYVGNGDVCVAPHPPSEMEMAWIGEGVARVFTAETWYRPAGARVAGAGGAETVLLAMPELADRRTIAETDRVILPTSWEGDRLPDATVLDWPAPTDRMEPRVRTEGRTFYHPEAPAMLDRNGSRIVRAALPLVESEVTVIVRTPEVHRPETRTAGKVTLDLRPPVDDWWDAYPPDADVLLLPRRYAGLSLSMWEAQAAGMAVVSLDLPPQNEWLHPAGLVPARRPRDQRMKGGRFGVWDADPADLAAVIDRLAADEPNLCEQASRWALAWAEERRWDGPFGDRWRATLTG